MRFSRLYDGEGGYSENPAQDGPDPFSVGEDTPTPTSPQGGGQAPNPPSADPDPGPNNSPAPQGGNTPPPTPPPPAVVSSVPGIKGSEATGGVQGSFGQAGTGGFSRRFGLPAAWFKGGPTSGLSREAASRGRDLLGKQQAGQVSGGFGAETVTSLAGPSGEGEAGGKNDEEWQRIIQAAMRNRFSR